MSTYRVWYHRAPDESSSVEVDAEDRAAAIAASDALLSDGLYPDWHATEESEPELTEVEEIKPA